MNCLCAIYVDRNQQTFLAKMTSFVMRYDIIYHSFLINSQCLMTWGVDSPVSGVAGCFAHKLIHPMFICHSLSLNKGINMKNSYCTCGSTTFPSRNFTQNISKINVTNIEIARVLQYYVFGIWNVVIEITRIIQMVYHSDHWTFFSNRSNRIQA